jgi:hypothetical protein
MLLVWGIGISQRSGLHEDQVKFLYGHGFVDSIHSRELELLMEGLDCPGELFSECALVLMLRLVFTI